MCRLLGSHRSQLQPTPTHMAPLELNQDPRLARVCLASGHCKQSPSVMVRSQALEPDPLGWSPGSTFYQLCDGRQLTAKQSSLLPGRCAHQSPGPSPPQTLPLALSRDPPICGWHSPAVAGANYPCASPGVLDLVLCGEVSWKPGNCQHSNNQNL